VAQKSAGRGVLYIAFAKFYFMIAGALIEFRLPAILSRATYGAYKTISSVVSPVNNVLVTGTIQSISRFTAQKPDASREVQATGLRMHVLVGLPAAILFMVLIAPLVGWFWGDFSKTGPLILAGGICIVYAFYAVFVGTANGLHEFHKQAGLDMTAATLRVIGILGLTMAGFGVYGAYSGWLAAAALVLVVAMFLIGLPNQDARAAAKSSVKPMTRYFLGVAIYLGLLNLIMVVDQLLIKKLAGDWYSDNGGQLGAQIDQVLGPWARKVSGFGQMDPVRLSDVQVAYYGAVQNLARLSYQAILAATFVIFPMVSKSTFEDDQDTTKKYIHVTMRYSLIFATALAVVMAALPKSLLAIPYPADYAEIGAPPLISLALGNVAFSIFAINGTILNGAGLTRQAIISAAITLVIAAGGNALVIPHLDPGRDLLLGAATTTGVAMLIGAALSGWQLKKHLGAFLPIASVVRVLIALAAAIALGFVLPKKSPLFTLVEAALIGCAFLAVLVGTRELGKKDLQSIIAVRKKRGTGGEA